ncbi:hypothetical protein BpHYR1_014269 [Brachionus plicatilis]|uniref:Uncharacterized protein n=1 Tax=Brachionus plicatilis TaxID=10195 RepID=A0A3M7SVZ6_BRAPC|nr:hypothetical protein BpHYR1_014269 [Brachionus plicatilis]
MKLKEKFTNNHIETIEFYRKKDNDVVVALKENFKIWGWVGKISRSQTWAKICTIWSVQFDIASFLNFLIGKDYLYMKFQEIKLIIHSKQGIYKKEN